MNSELLLALDLLEKEKGIKKEIIIESLEQALIAAYKRNYSSNQDVRVQFDEDTGDVVVFAQKVVVEDVQDADCEYPLSEALKIDPEAEVEDILEFPVTPRNFGRIAAQNAKQVIVQKIREAERNLVYNEYSSKENDIVFGTIQRQARNEIIVDIGKTEGGLPEKEQVRGERYAPGTRMRFYVTKVEQTTKGSQIKLSRTHPGLVKRLFELEVPEISYGTVEIMNVAREAGSRTKVAVLSHDPDVDPIGACVGQRGARVNAICEELRGEKIDIINWSEDPEEFIAASLSPSPVIRVDVNEEDNSARVIVPDAQLSLAIGAAGQNARLAARLTNWKIDIKSESQFMTELESEVAEQQSDVEIEQVEAEEVETEMVEEQLEDTAVEESVQETDIDEQSEQKIEE